MAVISTRDAALPIRYEELARRRIEPELMGLGEIVPLDHAVRRERVRFSLVHEALDRSTSLPP